MKALLLHGLNNSPGMMRAFDQELHRLGLKTAIGHLTGHYESHDRLNILRRATADQWLHDAEEFYRANADDELIWVGFSLGALVGLVLAQNPKFKFSKMILLAPAIYLRPWSHLPKFLKAKSLVLPSAMPANTRANRGTPVGAYQAMFDLIGRFDIHQLRTPSLTIISPLDELVDARKVQKNLPKVLTLKPGLKIQHLVTDEKFVGSENWQKMWAKIGEFIV